MAKEWDYTDTYVATCGKCCSSYMLGIAHERDCPKCLRELRGEEEEEDDNADN